MKIFTKALAAVMILAAAMSFSLSAQDKGHGKDDWGQRMRSERIAFITADLSLTPEEAQAFWPVYNQVQAEKKASMDAVMKAYMAIESAVNEGKSDAEYKSLVKAYGDALDASKGSDAKSIQSYLKVLSPEKVARLMMSEENFRRMQIRRIGGGHDGKDGGREGGPQGGEPRERR